MSISNKSKFKCVLCNLIFKTQDKLNKHKFTKIHLDNINKIEIEPLVNEKEDNTVTTYDLDPYLNKEYLIKLKNMDIGEGCQITFSNNNVINCEFNFLNNNIDVEGKTVEGTTVEGKTVEGTTVEGTTVEGTTVEGTTVEGTTVEGKTVEGKNTIIKLQEHIEVEKTSKQNQILLFLSNNQNHSQIYNKWFQILQKINNKDLKGLIKYIVDIKTININIKEKLLTVVKKYKQILVFKKQKGETQFNNNNINDIISLLVC